MHQISNDHKRMLTNITKITRQYLDENRNLDSLVVGISGGIDSALTCALAHEMLKDVQGMKLIGRSIPIETNTAQELQRARGVGEVFCDQFESKDLTNAYRNLYGELIAGTGRGDDDSTGEKIRRGNLKARVRMTYLFDLAQSEKGMVLSTDNYTELLLGFWTLHGDVGNYGLLQYLWKTEVYGLARYLVDRYGKSGQGEKADALQQCIDAVPTDGLGITASDFDQIGVSDYETADQVLIDYLNGDTSASDHPVIKRHEGSAFKRMDPQSIQREVLLQ
jgi:NAD+ synthase